MKCYEVWICLPGKEAHICKALLNRLTSDESDTFSNNFYQHHDFYNLLMSLPDEKDETYTNSIKCCCHLRIDTVAVTACPLRLVSLAIWVPKDKSVMQEKQ